MKMINTHKHKFILNIFQEDLRHSKSTTEEKISNNNGREVSESVHEN